MRFSSSEEELSTLIRVDKTRTLLSMQYISAFLFLPSTLVLLSYVATTVAGGSGYSFLGIENRVLDIGFLIVFFVSSVAGWLTVFFGVPFRDGDRITLIGKGLLMGFLTWPFVIISLFFDGRIALASCLFLGWLGLAVSFLPAMNSLWNRRLPVLGMLTVALGIPVLINPALWATSKSAPIREAYWGVYYPDYAVEEGEDFVAYYQDHEKRFKKTPRLLISKTGMFLVNVLGRPLSNSFNHCGASDNVHLFVSSSVDGCGFDKTEFSGNTLEIVFYMPGKLRCVNCREFGKPEHWMWVESLHNL